MTRQWFLAVSLFFIADTAAAGPRSRVFQRRLQAVHKLAPSAVAGEVHLGEAASELERMALAASREVATTPAAELTHDERVGFRSWAAHNGIYLADGSAGRSHFAEVVSALALPPAAADKLHRLDIDVNRAVALPALRSTWQAIREQGFTRAALFRATPSLLDHDLMSITVPSAPNASPGLREFDRLAALLAPPEPFATYHVATVQAAIRQVMFLLELDKQTHAQ